MALFKIFRGTSSNLGKSGNTTAAAKEGYAYFTPDNGKLYIDIATADAAVLGTNRIALNAANADTLGGTSKSNLLNSVSWNNELTLSVKVGGSEKTAQIPQVVSQNYWGTNRRVAYIATDGIMEIGRYLDFHPTATAKVTEGVRLDSGTSTTRRTFTFSSVGGEFVTHVAATKTGDTNKGVYINANGEAVATTYTIDAKIDSGTANRIAWYKGANEIASGTIVTDGNYLSKINYLSINTDHQTSYRLYVNGTSYHNGETIVAGTLRPEQTRTRLLGSSSYYWKGAFIWADGYIHPANWQTDLNWGQAYGTNTPYRGYYAMKAYREGRFGDAFGFMPAQAVTVEYTTNSGSSWAVNTNITDDNKRNLTNGNSCFMPVGNYPANYSVATGETAPRAVGQGVRITLDFTIENRTGYINDITIYYRDRGNAETCTLEIYNKNTDTWTTLETFTITNTSEWYRQFYTDQSKYMQGNGTYTSAQYFNKLRVTMIVTGVGTNTADNYKQYQPGIGMIWGSLLTAFNLSSNASYKYSTRLAYYMNRWNSPIGMVDYNNQGLGSARIATENVYIGDDLRYTTAGTEKWSTLILGNDQDIAVENAHSRGRILIYGNKTGYHCIYSADNNTNGYSAYLGKATGWIAIGGNGTSTGVGSATQPIYLNANGVLTAGTTLGASAYHADSYFALAGHNHDTVYVKLTGSTMTGRLITPEINVTRPMVISNGKIYSNITGSNVLMPAKTSMLFSDGIAFASPGLSAANDVGWIRMLGADENTSVLEIATGDDGGTSTGEKIVVRQYNTSNVIAKEAVLLDKQTGATSFPVSVTAPSFIGDLTGNASTADKLTGFSSRASTMTWGNQTGSVITCFTSSGGGGWGFRDNNPANGQLSMTIDGTIYIKEGQKDIGTAISGLSVSGKTITYTTLWGTTGTISTQDTLNTAGSTNSASKLYLIGATTQAANPTTNSYQYIYTNNGLLSALKLGLNLNGTEKAHLEWNDADQSIDFVFN